MWGVLGASAHKFLAARAIAPRPHGHVESAPMMQRQTSFIIMSYRVVLVVDVIISYKGAQYKALLSCLEHSAVAP